MHQGCEILKIQFAPSADLEAIEKEITNLEGVWKVKENWD